MIARFPLAKEPSRTRAWQGPVRPRRTLRQAFAFTTAGLAALSPLESLAQEHAASAHHAAGHAQFCDVTTATPEPVLTVADFDGDGTVTRNDISRLEAMVATGDDTAFFDRNADGTLDGADIDRAVGEIGARSTPTDRELAMDYNRTDHYRDMREAIADGYMPDTGEAHGHGVHWGQHPESGATGYAFAPGNPLGLNTDRQGNLWGVFYFIGPSPTRADGTPYPPGHVFRPRSGPPDGFFGADDVWHFHAGACFTGLDFDGPNLDVDAVGFRERLSPSACFGGDGVERATAQWSPQFHMIHARLYALNPCSTFAGAHPELAVGAANPADAIAHPGRTPDAPHPDDDFEGGTLCAWLAEIDELPAYCEEDRSG